MSNPAVQTAHSVRFHHPRTSNIPKTNGRFLTTLAKTINQLWELLFLGHSAPLVWDRVGESSAPRAEEVRRLGDRRREATLVRMVGNGMGGGGHSKAWGRRKVWDRCRVGGIVVGWEIRRRTV